eukprot:Clim_evm51s148 gene=Clim_evmTU51s148
MFEGIVYDLLSTYLSKYVQNLSRDKLKVALWAGNVELKDLVIENTVLESLDLPFDLHYGRIGKIVLKIPWRNIFQEPVVADIEDVFLLAKPAVPGEGPYDAETRHQHEINAKRAILDRLERKRKEFEQAQKEEQDQKEGSDQKKTTGLAASLTTTIVDNLQLHISKVHIRYEAQQNAQSLTGDNSMIVTTVGDEVATKETCDYAFGVTLHGLHFQSANEKWQPSLVSHVAIVHKLIDIQGVSIYMDTDAEHLVGLRGANAGSVINQRMKNLISRNPDDTSHMYILRPFTTNARLKFKKNAMVSRKEDMARVQIQIKLNKLTTELFDSQYQSVMDLASRYGQMQQVVKYRKHRPDNLRTAPPRVKWQYAFDCICDDLQQDSSHSVQKFILEACKYRRRYVTLWKSHLMNDGLTLRDTQEVREIEAEISVESTILFRHMARLHAMKEGWDPVEAAKKKEAADQANNSWASWLGFGGSSAPVKKDTDTDLESKGGLFDQMSEEEKHALYEQLEQDHVLLATPSAFPKGYVRAVLVAELEEFNVRMKLSQFDTDGQAYELLSMSAKETKIVLQEQPGSSTFSVKVGIQKMTLGHASKNILEQRMASAEQRVEQFFSAGFTLSPMDSVAAYAVKLRLLPCEVNAEPTLLAGLGSFFRTPVDVELQNLQRAASIRMTELRNQTAAGLSTLIQEHKQIDVDVDMHAPTIYVHHEQDNKTLAFDPGRLRIVTHLQETQKGRSTLMDLNDEEAVFEVDAEEDIRERAKQKMYDHFEVTISDVSAVLVGGKLDWRKTLQDSVHSKWALFKPMTLTLYLSKCIEPENLTFTQFRLRVRTDGLLLNLSADKVRALLLIAGLFGSRNEDGQETQEPPTPKALPAPEPQTLQLGRESVYYDADAGFDLSGPTRASRVNDAAFVEGMFEDLEKSTALRESESYDLFYDAQSQSAKNFRQAELELEIKEISLHLKTSSLDTHNLTELSLRNINLQVDHRSFTSKVVMRMRALTVVDASKQTGSPLRVFLQAGAELDSASVDEDDEFQDAVEDPMKLDTDMSGESLIDVVVDYTVADAPTDLLEAADHINLNVATSVGDINANVNPQFASDLLGWLNSLQLGSGSPKEGKPRTVQPGADRDTEESEEEHQSGMNMRLDAHLHSAAVNLMDPEAHEVAQVGIGALNLSAHMMKKSSAYTLDLGRIYMTARESASRGSVEHELVSAEDDQGEIIKLEYSVKDGSRPRVLIQTRKVHVVYNAPLFDRIIAYSEYSAETSSLVTAASASAAETARESYNQMKEESQVKRDPLPFVDVDIVAPLIILPGSLDERAIAIDLGRLSMDNGVGTPYDEVGGRSPREEDVKWDHLVTHIQDVRVLVVNYSPKNSEVETVASLLGQVESAEGNTGIRASSTKLGKVKPNTYSTTINFWRMQETYGLHRQLHSADPVTPENVSSRFATSQLRVQAPAMHLSLSTDTSKVFNSVIKKLHQADQQKQALSVASQEIRKTRESVRASKEASSTQGSSATAERSSTVKLGDSYSADIKLDGLVLVLILTEYAEVYVSALDVHVAGFYGPAVTAGEVAIGNIELYDTGRRQTYCTAAKQIQAAPSGAAGTTQEEECVVRAKMHLDEDEQIYDLDVAELKLAANPGIISQLGNFMIESKIYELDDEDLEPSEHSEATASTDVAPMTSDGVEGSDDDSEFSDAWELDSIQNGPENDQDPSAPLPPEKRIYYSLRVKGLELGLSSVTMDGEENRLVLAIDVDAFYRKMGTSEAIASIHFGRFVSFADEVSYENDISGVYTDHSEIEEKYVLLDATPLLGTLKVKGKDEDIEVNLGRIKGGIGHRLFTVLMTTYNSYLTVVNALTIKDREKQAQQPWRVFDEKPKNQLDLPVPWYMSGSDQNAARTLNLARIAQDNAGTLPDDDEVSEMRKTGSVTSLNPKKRREIVSETLHEHGGIRNTIKENRRRRKGEAEEKSVGVDPAGYHRPVDQKGKQKKQRRHNARRDRGAMISFGSKQFVDDETMDTGDEDEVPATTDGETDQGTNSEDEDSNVEEDVEEVDDEIKDVVEQKPGQHAVFTIDSANFVLFDDLVLDKPFPFFHMALSMTAEAHDWYTALKGKSRFELSASSFSFASSAWEPVIEPWVLLSFFSFKLPSEAGVTEELLNSKPGTAGGALRELHRVGSQASSVVGASIVTDREEGMTKKPSGGLRFSLTSRHRLEIIVTTSLIGLLTAINSLWQLPEANSHDQEDDTALTQTQGPLSKDLGRLTIREESNEEVELASRRQERKSDVMESERISLTRAGPGPNSGQIVDDDDLGSVSPFSVVNHTGRDVHICHGSEFHGNDAILLQYRQRYNLPHLKKHRKDKIGEEEDEEGPQYNLDEPEQITRRISFMVDGFSTIFPDIDVLTVGSRKYDITPSRHGRTMQIMVSVRIRRGFKIATISSPLTITNTTGRTIEVGYVIGEGANREVRPLHEMMHSTSIGVPLLVAYERPLVFRPVDDGGVDFSEEALRRRSSYREIHIRRAARSRSGSRSRSRSRGPPGNPNGLKEKDWLKAFRQGYNAPTWEHDGIWSWHFCEDEIKWPMIGTKKQLRYLLCPIDKVRSTPSGPDPVTGEMKGHLQSPVGIYVSYRKRKYLSAMAQVTASIGKKESDTTEIKTSGLINALSQEEEFSGPDWRIELHAPVTIRNQLPVPLRTDIVEALDKIAQGKVSYGSGIEKPKSHIDMTDDEFRDSGMDVNVKAMKYFKPAESQPVYNVVQGKEVDIVLAIDGLRAKNKGRSPLLAASPTSTSRAFRSSHLTQTLNFVDRHGHIMAVTIKRTLLSEQDYDDWEESIRMGKAPILSRMVVDVYVPYLFVNQTGMALRVRQADEHVFREGARPQGQDSRKHHPLMFNFYREKKREKLHKRSSDDDASGLVAVSGFDGKNLDFSHEAQISLTDSDWSPGFNLDARNTTGELIVKHPDKRREFEVTISIKPNPGFGLTTMIIVRPRFIFRNATRHDMRILTSAGQSTRNWDAFEEREAKKLAQERAGVNYIRDFARDGGDVKGVLYPSNRGSETPPKLSSKKSVGFFWPKKEMNPETRTLFLSVGVLDGSCSSPFSIDQPRNFSLRLYKSADRTDYLLCWIEIVVEEGSSIIVIHESSRLQPIRIENRCKNRSITVFQLDLRNDKRSHTRIPAGHTAAYALQFPKKFAQLGWYPAGGSESNIMTMQLEKVAKRQHNIPGLGRFAVLSFPDGLTNVVVFTDLSSVVKTVVQNVGSGSHRDELKDPDYIMEVNLAGMGVSLVHTGGSTTVPREVAYFSANVLTAAYTADAHGSQIVASLASIELDDQDFEAPITDMITPTAFRYQDPEAAEQEFQPAIQISLARSTGAGGVFSYYRHVSVLVQPIDIRLTDAFLINVLGALLVLSSAANTDLRAKYDRELFTLNATLANSGGPEDDIAQRTYFELIRLNPMRFNVSFQLVGGDSKGSRLQRFMDNVGDILVNLEDVEIDLNSLELHNLYVTQATLINHVNDHMYQQMVGQMYRILGCLNLLGSPVQWFHGVSDGVKDFFFEPIDGVLNGDANLIKHVGKGASALYRGMFGGTAASLGKISGTFGTGLATLAMDDEFKASRTKTMARKPQNTYEGMGRGGAAFAKGTFEGITGVFTKPIEGAASEGATGFIKGIGRGMAGLIAKPLTGLSDLTTATLQGIAASDKDNLRNRIRPPAFIEADGIVRLYDPYMSLGNYKLKTINNFKYLEHQLIGYVQAVDRQKKENRFCFFTDSAFIVFQTRMDSYAIANRHLLEFAMATEGVVVHYNHHSKRRRVLIPCDNRRTCEDIISLGQGIIEVSDSVFQQNHAVTGAGKGKEPAQQ